MIFWWEASHLFARNRDIGIVRGFGQDSHRFFEIRIHQDAQYPATGLAGHVDHAQRFGDMRVIGDQLWEEVP